MLAISTHYGYIELNDESDTVGLRQDRRDSRHGVEDRHPDKYRPGEEDYIDKSGYNVYDHRKYDLQYRADKLRD